jgi:hypothetical protein
MVAPPLARHDHDQPVGETASHGIIDASIHMRRSSGRWANAALLAPLLVWLSCSGSTTQPNPPQAGTNTPPVISSVSASLDRAEVNGVVDLTAVVSDAETALSSLAYTWTASAGTITGTGASARWTAPGTVANATVTVTLTVSEHYTSNKNILENKTTGSTTVHLNDSAKEVAALSTTFIDDFIHSERSADFCVRNFSDSCRGKTDEFNDITSDRAQFVHDPARSSYSVSSITYNTAGNVPSQATVATVFGPCRFGTQPKAGGTFAFAVGTCELRHIYENFQWRLCDSHFNDPHTEFPITTLSAGVRASWANRSAVQLR